VCNTLGAARGTHKQVGCQATVLNIPTEERSNEANIFLPVLARASAYKKHGMARLLCGVDKGGVQREEPNFAADMRALDAGVSIQIPDDVHGGVKWVRLRAWIMLASCDFLAKKSILPFSEGSAANCFCGDCDYDTRSQAAKRPLSFLRHGYEFKLRTWQELKSTISKMEKASKTVAKKIKRDHGLNKSIFPFHPDYFPHIDPCCVAPQDLLHLFPDGLLRSECAWMLYIFFSMGLCLDRFNEEVQKFKNFRADVRIPRQTAKLKEGTGGRPRRSATLRMSGFQCMHFALHR
jgi:hypothetical protein